MNNYNDKSTLMNQTEVPIWLRYNIETGKFDRYPENLKLVVDYLPKPAGDCHFFEIYYERIQEYDILKTEDLSVFCEAIGLDFADESDVFDPKHDIWVRKEALLLNAGIKEITQDSFFGFAHEFGRPQPGVFIKMDRLLQMANRNFFNIWYKNVRLDLLTSFKRELHELILEANESEQKKYEYFTDAQLIEIFDFIKMNSSKMAKLFSPGEDPLLRLVRVFRYDGNGFSLLLRNSTHSIAALFQSS